MLATQGGVYIANSAHYRPFRSHLQYAFQMKGSLPFARSIGLCTLSPGETCFALPRQRGSPPFSDTFQVVVKQPLPPSHPDLYCSETREYLCLTMFRTTERVFSNRSSLERPNAATLAPAIILFIVLLPFLSFDEACPVDQTWFMNLALFTLLSGKEYWRRWQYLQSPTACRHSVSCGSRFRRYQSQGVLHVKMDMTDRVVHQYFQLRWKQWMLCASFHEACK